MHAAALVTRTAPAGCAAALNDNGLWERGQVLLHVQEKMALHFASLHLSEAHIQVEANGVGHGLMGHELHAAATVGTRLRLRELDQRASVSTTLKSRQDGHELEQHEPPIHVQADCCSDASLGFEHP